MLSGWNITMLVGQPPNAEGTAPPVTLVVSLS
jgi:hypothetical protein